MPTETKDFDEFMAEQEVTRGHRVKLKFDGDGVRGKLIHPDDGSCRPATQCTVCGRSFEDTENEGCYDCKGRTVEPDTCWLSGWFDDYTVSEILVGSVEVPVAAFIERDYLRARIQPDKEG
jgi:hypothetical protein